MKKRLCLVLIITVILLCLTSCEYGMDYVKIDIGSYPHKLIYIVGDKELDIKGCTVLCTARDGRLYSEDLYINMYTVSNNIYTIEHTVDFTKEGVFTISIIRGDLKCQFPIQVISRESLQLLLQGES